MGGGGGEGWWEYDESGEVKMVSSLSPRTGLSLMKTTISLLPLSSRGMVMERMLPGSVPRPSPLRTSNCKADTKDVGEGVNVGGVNMGGEGQCGRREGSMWEGGGQNINITSVITYAPLP